MGMLAVGICNSLEPRPKPLMTGPDRRSGKGDEGPFSGPTISGRSVAGARIFFGLFFGRLLFGRGVLVLVC